MTGVITGASEASLPRKDAIKAVARMQALLHLVEDDAFLKEVLNSAQQVVERAGLLGDLGQNHEIRDHSSGLDTRTSTVQANIPKGLLRKH
ncbi:hypothetical protein NNA36_03860 [Shimia sp. CNT1-13L.2]|uniref:hypothetical protein n=1 Tax=Shimia sp. CNT1-13L.2 TaxID=2959663 RepID=UPI0020CC64EA|nr:hypothetical protein [Shimia sp. CNT1-13L.2]MCP9481091.1 hypothetical protein [Shimia sp. CNT1-13L.2]